MTKVLWGNHQRYFRPVVLEIITFGEILHECICTQLCEDETERDMLLEDQVHTQETSSVTEASQAEGSVT